MTEMAVSGQVTITVLQNVLLHLIVFAQDVQCNCCSAKCSVLFFLLSRRASIPGQNQLVSVIIDLNKGL